jgi:uracil-DNA glycosylase
MAVNRASRAVALVAAVAGCDRCPLAAAGRPSLTRPPWRTDLLILGEAPGQTEAKVGTAFVGRSGQTLDRALRAAGLSRERAFVTNVVLHHPTRSGGIDRAPRPSEVSACAVWLDAQLSIVRPKVVLALGKVAAARLLGRSTTLEDVRGRAHRCGDRWIVPTYHPASLNRATGREAAFGADVRLAAALVSAGRADGSSKLRSTGSKGSNDHARDGGAAR